MTMGKTSPEQRRRIAVLINSSRTKKGKVKDPQWINSQAELSEQFRNYVREEYLSRFSDWGNYTEAEVRGIHRSADVVATLTAESLEYHMPALTFFFKQYLTQH